MADSSDPGAIGVLPADDPFSALAQLRRVELSHLVIPGEEEYVLEVKNRFVDDMLPDYRGKRPADAWYIMSEVSLWSHVGTHMEAPFHYLRDGIDISEVSFDRVVGMCTLVTFNDKGVGEPISLDELQERGSAIQPKDIVFVRTDSGHYRTERSHDRPYFTEDAIRWLAEDRQISLMGVDCSGIENRTQPRQPNHEMLFKNGIPLIEHLAHLDRLSTKRFFVVAVPWRVRGLEASPVSVVAFEDVRGQ
jgi:arylformamidase